MTNKSIAAIPKYLSELFFSQLYDVAPLISRLMAANLHGILSHIVSYLRWTHLAVFMLLCHLDLRPILSNLALLKLLRRGPGCLRDQSFELSLQHFRQIPTERFWNAVALLKRLYKYPSMPLAPGRVQVGQIWKVWKQENYWKTGRVRNVEFNPRHDVVVLVHETRQDNSNFLSIHWYGHNCRGGQFQTHKGENSAKLDVSWSKEGSFLLVASHYSKITILNIFAVDALNEELIYVKGLQLNTLAGKVTARLWLTDDSFIFPGYEDPIRVSRPWVYKINDGFRRLIIQQPRRDLRKEHRRGLKLLARGLLTALGNGFCCKTSLCRVPEKELEVTKDVKKQATSVHSIIHFLDQSQAGLADLAIPGILLALTGQGDLVYVLYRENSQVTYEPDIPLIFDPLPIHQQETVTRSKRPIKIQRHARLSKITRTGPFFYSLNKAACVSDSSSADDEAATDDEETGADAETANKNFRSSNEQKQEKMLESYSPQCGYKSTPKLKNETGIFLTVFNLATRKLELSSTRLNDWKIDGVFPEKYSGSNFSSPEVVSEMAKTTGILSVTENLLIIRLDEVNNGGRTPPSIVLHLGTLSSEAKRVPWSVKSVFMHPTKNVLLQFDEDINYPSFPLTLGSCTDLLCDYVASIERNRGLMTSRVHPLFKVEYIVTDENGLPTEASELRADPAYVI